MLAYVCLHNNLSHLLLPVYPVVHLEAFVKSWCWDHLCYSLRYSWLYRILSCCRGCRYVYGVCCSCPHRPQISYPWSCRCPCRLPRRRESRDPRQSCSSSWFRNRCAVFVWSTRPLCRISLPIPLQHIVKMIVSLDSQLGYKSPVYQSPLELSLTKESCMPVNLPVVIENPVLWLDLLCLFSQCRLLEKKTDCYLRSTQITSSFGVALTSASDTDCTLLIHTSFAIRRILVETCVLCEPHLPIFCLAFWRSALACRRPSRRADLIHCWRTFSSCSLRKHRRFHQGSFLLRMEAFENSVSQWKRSFHQLFLSNLVDPSLFRIYQVIWVNPWIEVFPSVS